MSSMAHASVRTRTSSHRLSTSLGASMGLLYVVLVFAGYLALGPGSTGNVPAAGASPAEIARWLTANPMDDRLWTGAYVEALGLFALVAFVSFLWSLLRRGGDEPGWLAATAFGAGVLGAAIKLASFPAGIAAQYRAGEELDPALAAALVDMNQASYTLAFVADAVMLLAAGAAIVRTRALPRWLGVSALAIGASVLATTPATLSAPAVAEVPIQLVVLWIIAASALMLVRAGRGTLTRA